MVLVQVGMVDHFELLIIIGGEFGHFLVVDNVVFLVDKLLGLFVLETLNGLSDGIAQDIPTMSRGLLSIVAVGEICLGRERRFGRVVDLFFLRSIRDMAQRTIHGINHLVSEGLARKSRCLTTQLVLDIVSKLGLATSDASIMVSTVGTNNTLGDVGVCVFVLLVLLALSLFSSSGPFGIMVLFSLVGFGCAAEIVGGESGHVTTLRDRLIGNEEECRERRLGESKI